MKISKRTIDKGLHIAVAVWTPLAAVLVKDHVVAASTMVDVGSIVAAGLAAYHGGAAVQKRQTVPHVQDIG